MAIESGVSIQSCRISLFQNISATPAYYRALCAHETNQTRAPVNLELRTCMEQVQQHALPRLALLNAVTDHPFSQDRTWKGGGKTTPSLARIPTHINVCCSQCLESLQNKVSPPRSLNARVASLSLTISKTPFYQHTIKTES